MAWRNIKVEWINTCDITDFSNFYNETSWHGWGSFPSGAVKGDDYYRSENYMNFYPDQIIWGSGSSGLGVGYYQFGIALYYNGSILGATNFPTASYSNGRLRFYAIVDDETQKGWFGAIDGYDSADSYQYGFQKVNNMAWATMQGYIYQILTQSQVVTYTWQSVASVTGKSGTLNLSQIASASINDGEAVSGASASAFDSLTAQVSTLVRDDSAMSGADAGGISGSGSNSANQSTGNAFGLGESGTNLSGGGSGLYGGYKGTSAKSGGAGSGYIGNSLVSNKKMVGYNVPTSSAESTKTESINDVSASAVSGKPKSGNGFAKIKFLRDAWGGEEVPILWAGNSNKMTVQISNSSILFKLYTDDSVIYSFIAYVGSTIYDTDNIYVGFLIDTDLELAKPSMVYANGSVLSYNQEEPTEAQMGDIYTWISPGLPSE